MAEHIRKVAADLCSYVDEDNGKLKMEVSLPGVKKEGISLKIRDDSFSLTAPRDDIEFVSSGTFCCPVKPDSADATYENGLLRIEIPFKDVMEEAVTVNIH